MNKPLLAVIVILAIAVVYVAIDKLWVTDEEIINEQIHLVSQAIEHKDLELCMRYISDDFMSAEKRVDKNRLLRLAQGKFAQADNLKMILAEKEISVDGDEARVFLKFRLMGEYIGRMDQFVGQRGFILGEPLKAARVTLHLRRRLPAGDSDSGQPQFMVYSVSGFDPGYKMPTR